MINLNHLTKNILFVIVLGATVVASCKAQQIENKNINNRRVYLFAGQSNMDGRANGGDLSVTDLGRLAKVGDRIQFYYNHEPVTPLQLSSASRYIEGKFGFSKVFGPELFFGIEMAEKYPNDEFIFIKRSRGGTSLYGCWNPDWTEEKARQMKEERVPKLYSDFIKYTKSILSEYKKNDYELKGMLWVQGEADGNVRNYGEAAITYGENLKNLIESVREDLEMPNMPFAMFQVGQGKVIEGMIETAQDDSNVYFIPQSQDENSPDYYEQYDPPLGHYTTNSMKRIGLEFFKIFNNILE